jgi:transposase
MYDFMDRSAIKAMCRRGISKSEIARKLNVDRKTVRRILSEPPDSEYQRRPLGSEVDRFKDDICRWLDEKIPVTRMLEMVREDAENPYTGGRTVFFDRVKLFKDERMKDSKQVWLRFEGLPGEYLQVDWGEVRNFPFLAQKPATRYFFCARLKHSRFCYVEFTTKMDEETLIRCMIRAFEHMGGIPCILVFDNMKTVIIKRDERNQPIWNKTFLKFAGEMEFHPEVCYPYSANQKGTVESGVKWVKSSFLKGREFLDDNDLQSQCRCWMDKKNNSISQSHGKIPVELLKNEQKKFIPLATDSASYGIFGQVVVGPESLVNIEGNRYSVPVGYVGRTLSVRIRQVKIDFYEGEKLAASHPRAEKGKRRIIIPEHFEPVLEKKPRGRVMVYRDYLMSQDVSIEAYIMELCRRFRGSFNSHILKMYELFKEHGREELGCACALASEHGAYGADYLVSLIRSPRKIPSVSILDVEGIPPQNEVDRTLSLYETYVIGGERE